MPTTPTNLYRIERCTTLTAMTALAPEWQALLEQVPGAPVFLAPQWLLAWWRHFGKGCQPWLLAARDTDGRLVGLAPWMVQTLRFGPIKLKALRFIGSGEVYPVHLDTLTLPACRAEACAALEAYLLAHRNEWDVLSFSSLAADSSLNRLSRAPGGAHGMQVTSPYITLPASWEAYSKTLSKKLRRNLRYFTARLQDDYPGQVAFSRLTDPASLPAAMQKLEAFGRVRWRARGKTTAFDDPAFCAFQNDVSAQALQEGWLRLYQLAVGDKLVALFLCFRCLERTFAYQMGFDAAWSSYSPGRLLIAFGVQSAIEEGAGELDWLAGENEYKLAWTDKLRVEQEVLYCGSWLGGVWITWRKAQQVLAGWAKKALPQTTVDRLQRLLTKHHAKDKGAGDEPSS